MAQQYSRNRTRRMNVTRGGHGSAASREMAGDGEEVGGVGSRHSAVLNERANKSLNRNAGPSRGSVNNGTIPNVGMGSRRTGRTG